MESKSAWSNWRQWAIALGALILFLVVFDQLERWVKPDAPPGAEVASDPAAPLEPIRPEVTRLGSSGVRVVVEGGHRLTLNLDDEARADRLITCIEEAIATSPALTEGEAGQPPESNGLFARRARAEQVWNEVIRIHNDCTSLVDAF